MPQWDPATLTPQQRKWFASVRENLQRETGRSLEAWGELARDCPETGHRARLAWMKSLHGLGQNRASLVLAQAFPGPPPKTGPKDDPLWRGPASRSLLEAVAAVATGLDGVVTGRRKAFTAFSRRYQFAAIRPLEAGGRLGLAVSLDADPRLSPPGNGPWSERLTAEITLAGPQALDAGLVHLLRLAWERS